MAGPYSSLRPNMAHASSQPLQTFTAKLLLFTTIISLSLACFAFFLQWHGGFDDPLPHWNSEGYKFDELSKKVELKMVGKVHSSNSDWQSVLTQHSSPTFPFFGDLRIDSGSDQRPKICIGSTTSAGLEQILPWIFFHKVIGVSAFYLFLEGKAASPEVSKVLKSVPGVRVVPRTRELDEQQSRSRIWNETWLSGFFYKPCNYELFVKQSLNMETAIFMAKEDRMDWIFHLDSDELLHPAGTREYSLRELMSFVPEEFDNVIFPNMESCVERDDVKDPFTEVSLFKKSYDHLPPELYFKYYKEVAHNNPNFYITYGNGKSAARVQDHLRPDGAHRWFNYMRTPNATIMEEAVVLHYTYTKFSDLTSRRDRCNCKLTKEDLKRCFMLDFDKEAYVIASTATKEEMLRWYREKVVWSDSDQVLNLIRNGIITRIYAPMAIIEGLREAGVFTSVINSASSNFSSDKLLSSTDSSISIGRKIVSEGEFQAAARRLLEVAEHISQPSAIPPLSPPVPHDLKLDI